MESPKVQKVSHWISKVWIGSRYKVTINRIELSQPEFIHFAHIPSPKPHKERNSETETVGEGLGVSSRGMWVRS